MSNKTQLQTNNTALDALITRVNAAKDVAASLPEAGGGSSGGAANDCFAVQFTQQGLYEILPFESGMTWRMYYDSYLPPLFNDTDGNIKYRIEIDEDLNQVSFRFLTYTNGGGSVAEATFISRIQVESIDDPIQSYLNGYIYMIDECML